MRPEIRKRLSRAECPICPDLAHCAISCRCKNSFGYWRISGLPYLATSTTEPDPQ